MAKIAYIPQVWDLPESIRRRLGESVGKQRLISEEGHVLLLLHQVPKAEDDEHRNAMVAWRNPAGEWKSAPLAGGLAGLDAHIAAYRTTIHELDGIVEGAKTARQYFDVMRRVTPLQRATRHMAEVLQAARQELPDEHRVINLRDQAAELERGVDLVASDAKAGMDFTVAEAANQQAISAELANQEARRLNRLAAFFLPLATIVAVFGMNSPEEMMKDPGFWCVLGGGVVLGFFVNAIISLRGRNPDR